MISDFLFKGDPNGYLVPGKVLLPDPYVSTVPHALMVFTNGVGEAGDGTLGSLWKLLWNNDAGGPLGVYDKTKADISAVKDPITGWLKPFIHVSLQGVNSWAV